MLRGNTDFKAEFEKVDFQKESQKLVKWLCVEFFVFQIFVQLSEKNVSDSSRKFKITRIPAVLFKACN